MSQVKRHKHIYLEREKYTQFMLMKFAFASKYRRISIPPLICNSMPANFLCGQHRILFEEKKQAQNKIACAFSCYVCNDFKDQTFFPPLKWIKFSVCSAWLWWKCIFLKCCSRSVFECLPASNSII